MRIRSVGPELTPELRVVLEGGPSYPWGDDMTDEDIELAWGLHGATIVDEWEYRHASRPWGWWVFEIGEQPPPMEPGAKEIRLAELGELTDQELADLERHADEARTVIASAQPRAYVATAGGERIDGEQEAVDLWERVREIRQEGSDRS